VHKNKARHGVAGRPKALGYIYIYIYIYMYIYIYIPNMRDSDFRVVCILDELGINTCIQESARSLGGGFCKQHASHWSNAEPWRAMGPIENQLIKV